MKITRISVIILNWNQWEKTIRCLESVEESDYDDLGIIIVDNSSEDESAQRILSWIEDYSASGRLRSSRIELVRNPMNLGYSGGNNVGMKRALEIGDSEFILILNNDTIVTPDAIRILADHARVHTDFAFLGPTILYLHAPSVIQSRGFVVDDKSMEVTSKDHGRNCDDLGPGIVEVDALFGACILARTSHLINVGMLDETFFLYSEDIDWCIRATRRGYRIGCVPSARIWHEDQGSSRLIGDERWRNFARGRAILLMRYARGSSLVRYAFLRLPIQMAAIARSERRALPAIRFLWGFINGILDARHKR